MFKLKSPIKAISDAVSSAGSALSQGWNDVINAGSNLVSDAAQSVSQTVTSVVDQAVTAVTDVVSNAQAAIDSAAEGLSNAASTVADWLEPAADALDSTVGALQDAVAGAGDWVDGKVAEFQESPVDAIATMTPAYVVASLFDPDISRTPISDLIDVAADTVSAPLDGIIAAKDWITKNWPWLVGGAVSVVAIILLIKGRLLRRLVRG